MADLSDLVAQYRRFDELEPVSNLREIKSNTLVKIKGTLASYEPDDAYRKSIGSYSSPIFRGRIGIEMFMEESQEHIEFAGNYVGINGQVAYSVLKTLLNAIGIGGELEVVIRKAAGPKQDSVLQRIIGNGEYLVRGSGRMDYLQKLSNSALIILGIIKTPESP
ncbi:MAG: hypothetical protein IH934_00880 [Nanoarchaeota archaeon]|nr:hypothetical protein [Nanoarchaeota archaeon]